MRNPDRIEPIMRKLTLLWKSSPDLRFFQLIHNIQGVYSNCHDDYGKTGLGFDFFYLEDDECEALLDVIINSWIK